MREKLSFKNSQGIKLVGIVDIPKIKRAKYPTVIFFHGFGSEKSSSDKTRIKDLLADKLTQQGFLVYRFDFTGCGESQGVLKTVTITRQVNDLKDVVRFVKRQDLVNGQRLTGIGESLGGTTLLAAKSKEFKTVIFISPLVFINELRSGFKHRYNPQGLSYLWSENKKQWKIIGSQFWVDAKKYDLLKCIKAFKGKKLFIHGEKDFTVHPADSWHLYDQAKSPKEIRLYKTLNHTLRNSPEKYRLVDDLAKWLKKNLSPSARKPFDTSTTFSAGSA